MKPGNYLYRAPLLDGRQHVRGYKLDWQQHSDRSPASSKGAFARLVSLIARAHEKPTSRPFFIETGASALPVNLLHGLIPENIVLIFDQADLSSAGALSRVMELNAHGFGLAMRDSDRAALASDDGLLSLMTHVKAEFVHPDLAEMARLARQTEHPLCVVVNNVPAWQEFEVYSALGVMSFFGNLCALPRRQRQSMQRIPQTGFGCVAAQLKNTFTKEVMRNSSPDPRVDAIENSVVVKTAVALERQDEIFRAFALQDEISSDTGFCSMATDERGVIQIFNIAAERMLGHAASDVVNKMTPADISDPQELMARAAELSLEFTAAVTPGFEALVFKASRSIEEIYPLTCIRKDGSRFSAMVSVTALRNAQDGIIGYLLNATDITGHKLIGSGEALTSMHTLGAEDSVPHDTAIFYDRDHKLQAIYAAAINATERKKAQTQLLESEARTRAILAAAVDAIIIIDASGTIESLNTATEKLFGYTAQEMVGKNVKMLMPAPYQAEHDGYLHNYTTTGVKKIIGIGRQVVGQRKNGETFPMELAVSEVQTGGRRLFTGIVRDISERHRIERSLQEKNIELEHANRMKSEFLATMSHELRTPLNAIIGFSEALKDGLIGPMTETQVEYIGDIFTSGQHLLSLINDILDLSKVEAGMMTLELEATDLKSLLSNSLSIVKEKAATQRITLELKADDDLGVPYLDMRKTKQIIYNLLSNAVKFSASGARVVLSASRVPRSSVGKLRGEWPIYGFPLADNEHNQFLELCVSDRGIGISEANMDKLFIAFSQIDSSLARRFEGTGLGLAMVKQLTELQGGTVAVASEEGMGASFVAWLPLRGFAI